MLAAPGLDIVRHWQDPSRACKIRGDVAQVGRFPADVTEGCLKVLWAADAVFLKLGPHAGLDDVVAEIGEAEADVRSLFGTDENLRRAYRIWTYDSVLETIRDEIEELDVEIEDNATAIETWFDSLITVLFTFDRYYRIYCQFDIVDAGDVDLFRHTCERITTLLTCGVRVGACAVPDMDLAAFKCAHFLTQPLRRAGWTPPPAPPKTFPRVSKARAARLEQDRRNQRLKAFFAEVAPYVSAMERGR